MARLEDLLARCLQELEANGGDVEACLCSHPEQADKLRPYLILWAGLRGAAAAAAPEAALSGGREKVVRAAIDVKTGKEERMMWKSPVYRLATAVGGALLLGGAVLGIAGAAGGGGVANDVLHTLSVTSPGGSSEVASPTPTPDAKSAATNPDGHCVMLPKTSDVVRHPEKHPDWHVLGGDCPTPSASPGGSPTLAVGQQESDDESGRQEGDNESPEASPGPRTAATNPGGHCVALPDTSDIIRHPDKHPDWHVLGGDCGGATSMLGATPELTGSPTPPQEPTPTGTASAGESQGSDNGNNGEEQGNQGHANQGHGQSGGPDGHVPPSHSHGHNVPD